MIVVLTVALRGLLQIIRQMKDIVIGKRAASTAIAILFWITLNGLEVTAAENKMLSDVKDAAASVAKAAAEAALKPGADPKSVANAAVAAAKKAKKEVDDEQNLLDQKKQNEIRPDGFQFSFGTKLLNPYALQSQGGTNYLLSNRSDTEVDPFLELSYRNSWVVSRVLSSEKEENRLEASLGMVSFFGASNKFKAWWKQDDFFQQDIALGFVIRGSTDPLTEQSGNAIAGSGDFYLNYNTDILPLYRSVSDATAKQFSLSSGFSLVTDRAFQDIHPNAFIGSSFEVAFKWPSPDKVGLLTVRGGYGWIDSPQITGGTTNIIVGADRGLPIFALEGAPMVSAQASIPMADGVFFTAGGQAFIRDTPAPWSLSLGLTLSMDRLKKFKDGLFGSLVSEDAKE